MRQEVQVYVTIKKLKSLSQRFEESDEGDRQMGFGVVMIVQGGVNGDGENTCLPAAKRLRGILGKS